MKNTLGILGGGQLGRMFVQNALNYNLDIHILDPDANAPCKHLVSNFMVGSLTDFDTVYQFGKNLDIITIEIENVNTQALEKLQAEGKKVFPQPEVIRLIQNKRTQKQFYQDNQIPTAEFVLIDKQKEIEEHLHFLPAFQKLGEGGYDGRGVQLLTSALDLHKSFPAESLLEKAVDFEKEISIIIAGNEAGEMTTFPPVELLFDKELNLVDYLFAPADISHAVAQEAGRIAKKIMNALEMVGVLAIEMFLTKDGELLVNEIAPRPHNSGHHTIEANYTSQFDQHLRAILNLPLGSTATRQFAGMVNLLGSKGYEGEAKYEGIAEILKMEGVYVHLYGKKITKSGRKMGHITVLADDIAELRQKMAQIKQGLRVIS
jgi:5-(carboxyamino)imidazole ribonucleotide synthase